MVPPLLLELRINNVKDKHTGGRHDERTSRHLAADKFTDIQLVPFKCRTTLLPVCNGVSILPSAARTATLQRAGVARPVKTNSNIILSTAECRFESMVHLDEASGSPRT